MDDKANNNNPGMPLIPPRRGLSPARFLLAIGYLAIVGFTYCYFHSTPPNARNYDILEQVTAPHLNQRPVVVQDTQHELVPLEAHIMSKCPDAKDCLRDLVLPTMQKVLDKVNFTLSFIGTPTEHDDGVACKHGAEECLGNIIELCAQRLYPDPKTYLGFVMCLTKDYTHIPQRSLIEDCALEHAIDFNVLNDCATKDDGAFGQNMLRGSVKRTAAAGVTKSCTVRLNNEIYCVRDNRQWKECPSGPSVNDLVIAIQKLYRQRA
ncbi:hypothetical protein QBC35DRAFT_514171 [Podospora australis]|uniref:Gamma interferon inducible lysosomal thiol reductase n=1 Tax=Podospora australis TaxID=1536484 RepID=A0AAN7AKZ2_9PEZI|nr:hypothetical protein QBC35DRAFT_514171 [Podospora australis]